MTDQDIKQKVYQLLWDLFGKECPLILKLKKELLDKYELEYKQSDILYTYELTILNKILPARIDIVYDKEDDWYDWYKCSKIIKQTIYDNWEINHITEMWLLDYEDEESEYCPFDLKWNPDFWQAVLNLLEAIQNHPDKDRMMFKWGEGK